MLDQLDAAIDAAASPCVGDAAFAVQLQRRLNRLTAVVTAQLGAVDRAGLIGSARSTAAWFAQQTHVPAHEAKRMVRNARSLPAMPKAAAAFAAGEISSEHVRVLATAHDLNPDAFEKAEEELLDAACRDRFDQLKRHVTSWRQLAEPDLVEDEAAKLHDDRDGYAARTGAQRRADVFTLMAERSAACPQDSRKARVLVQVLVGYETFNGRVCELADGTVLTPGQVVSLLDEADIQRVVFESPSNVLDVSHRQRLFTGATRTAVQLAHLECQGDPSCTERFDRCEIDHIQPWEHCGETTQDNGRPLCRWHHRRRQRSP